MPTKTGAKIRIIVLGTGPDAEEAREIAAADADVAIAAKFTKTVTHLVIDDTVKSSEARVKKAGETGVPVLELAELKELLVADAAVDPEPAASAAETDTAETDTAEAEPAETDAAEVATESDTEPAAVPAAEPETADPVAEAASEPEPAAEAEPAAEPVAVEASAAPEADPTPEPDSATEPGSAETDSDSEKVVPAQAEAPKMESEPEIDQIDEPAEERAEQIEADDETAKTAPKPGLMAKLKSIFGKTGARK